MKILLVSLNHKPEQTGIGKFQGEMAAWFAARGHQIRVVAAPPYYPEWKIGKGYSGWRYKTEVIDGARVYRIPLYVPSIQNGLRRLLHLLSFAVASLPVIVAQALLWRPQAIVVTAPPLMAAPAVVLAGKLCGAVTHLHVQDFEVDAAFHLGLLKNERLYRLALRIENALLRSFSSISTISPRMRDKLWVKDVPPKKISLLPNWAGLDAFDLTVEKAPSDGGWRARLRLNPDEILALYSGNLGRKQGLEVIVKAARLLQNTPSIRLVVSGDGAGREDLVAQASGLNNIIFLPVQPLTEFIGLMHAADIHLLPQKAEAADLVMPSKLGNMLASGKPIVAGAEPNTQIYDAIQDCGIAAVPDDAESFMYAILKLASDKDLRARMGEAGRRRARAEWSQDGILKKFESQLEKTCR